MVATDADPSRIEALRANQFQALIVQDPSDVGTRSVMQAVAAIEGKTVEPLVQTGVRIITQENMAEPASQAAIHKSSC